MDRYVVGKVGDVYHVNDTELEITIAVFQEFDAKQNAELFAEMKNHSIQEPKRHWVLQLYSQPRSIRGVYSTEERAMEEKRRLKKDNGLDYIVFPVIIDE